MEAQLRDAPVFITIVQPEVSCDPMFRPKHPVIPHQNIHFLRLTNICLAVLYKKQPSLFYYLSA